MLMKRDRVWKGPIVEHGTPIYLHLSLEGRWTQPQVVRVTHVLAEELAAANCELIAIDVTTNRDATKWYLLRVRDLETGQIRPARVEFLKGGE